VLIYKKFILYLILLISVPTKAQENIKKNPKKAAFYSAIIPGSGQFYTKKYWKIPIIYAGFITSAYYANESYNSYKEYKNAYILRTDNNPNTNDNFNNYTNENLVTLTEYYRRNTEISVLFFGLTYILNILDASVSAHLFEYNITEDISIHLQPLLLQKETKLLSLSINL